MAHGENAGKHHGREYWSRRLGGMVSWGRIGKWMTHRRERAEAKRTERELSAKCYECDGPLDGIWCRACNPEIFRPTPALRKAWEDYQHNTKKD